MLFSDKNLYGFLFIILCFLWLQPCQAQFILKEKEMRYHGDSPFITIIKKTVDGGFITGGSAPESEKEEGSKELDFLVIKRRADGSVAWEKRYKKQGYEYLSEIVVLPNSGYLLCGYQTNREVQIYRLYDKQKPGHGSMVYQVVRIDANGKLLWEKNFDSRNHDLLRVARLLPDGGFILGGNTIEPDPQKAQQRNYYGYEEYDTKSTYWLVRLDAKGNLRWQRRYASPNDAILNAIEPTVDGFLLAGRSSGGIGEDRTVPKNGKIDFWVIKTDTSGNKLWDNAYGGDVYDFVKNITRLADGNYLVSGNYYAVKIDKDGKQFWEKNYLQKNKPEHQVYRVLPTPDGGFLMSGSGISQKFFYTDKTYKDYDFYIVKADKNGNMVWSQLLGGARIESLLMMVPEKENTYLIAGISTSEKGYDIAVDKKGASDIWMIEIKEVQGPAVLVDPSTGITCAGNTLSVPFKTNWLFEPDNVFTAQLSGPDGNFDNPVIIGQVKGRSADSVITTIPANIPSGKNYHIRVSASNPPVSSSGSHARLEILNSDLAAKIHSPGPGFVILKPEKGIPPYQYSVNQSSYFPYREDNLNLTSNLSIGKNQFTLQDAAGCMISLPVENFPLKHCHDTISGGGVNYSFVLHQLAGTGASASLNYNIPEQSAQIEIYQSGKKIATTGKAVNGSGSLKFNRNPSWNEDKFYVIVYTPDPQTQWTYKINCTAH